MNEGEEDEYFRIKLPLASDYNIMAYADSDQFATTIWEDMPKASATILGGIKVGTGLTIDAYGVLNAAAGSPGSGTWGSITGTLGDQTDLVNALATKANASDMTTALALKANLAGTETFTGTKLFSGQTTYDGGKYCAWFDWDAIFGDGVWATFGASGTAYRSYIGWSPTGHYLDFGIDYYAAATMFNFHGKDVSGVDRSLIKAYPRGGVELYYTGTKRFETTNTGIEITGSIVATGGNSTNWNSAYGWGNHAGLYRPIAWMPSYSDVGACASDDARLSNARVASDVYSWAKASSKPSYTYSEVGADPAGELNSTNYHIIQESGKLVIKYGSTIIFSIDSDGLIKAKDNIQARATL
jgi:hypothetical protein